MNPISHASTQHSWRCHNRYLLLVDENSFSAPKMTASSSLLMCAQEMAATFPYFAVVRRPRVQLAPYFHLADYLQHRLQNQESKCALSQIRIFICVQSILPLSRRWKTSVNRSKYSSSFDPECIISSRYAPTPGTPFNKISIKRWKVQGAAEMPNGNRRTMKCPLCVFNVSTSNWLCFYSSPIWEFGRFQITLLNQPLQFRID